MTAEVVRLDVPTAPHRTLTDYVLGASSERVRALRAASVLAFAAEASVEGVGREATIRRLETILAGLRQ